MEKVKIDEFIKYKFLSGVKHSPDGKNVCFVLHETDLEENKYLSNLWLYNIEKEAYFKLTACDTERSFLWLDNENIMFPDVRNSKDKEKKENGEEFTQYYKISINGGEAAKFIRIPKSVNSIKPIVEGSYIFTSDYNIGKPDLNSLSEEEKAKEFKARKEEKDYEVLEEIPFWSNGGGFTNKNRNRLYIYEVNSGEVKAITDEYTNVESFNLNEDRTKVVIVSYEFKDKMPLVNDLKIYDLSNKSFTNLNKGIEISYSYAGFIASDALIFAGTDMKEYGINENSKLYTLNLNSNEIKCITPDFDAAMDNSVGSDCRYGGSDSKQLEEGYLYFVTTEGDSSYLNRIDKEGNFERVICDEGSVDGISVNSGSVIYIGMKPNKLQELYIKKEGFEKQLTNFNEWIHEEKKISAPEAIKVETEPGVIIEGWVIKPVDFEEGKKYPAILDIHGGPKTVYGTVFFHEMQYWANEGYAVFYCNPRGSDGRGNEFADIRGKYGTIDYVDIMKFTDEVLRTYDFIDADRIGVTGGSYGGFMTNWIIGHTDRFRAAASQRSISNWISKFNTTDIGYFFVDDQIAATPWNNQEKLWEHSPLKYADRVKTPTLFLHSEEDYRCWLVEGIQMFTALKYHGVESRLCMFRGENHELSRSGKPKHRVRRLKEITDWFDKYLK
ncbi:S9 family peptidase [Clostridium swellfunianum]|uniref:alpha/beta hydrolase family protein n=1 Tax=Clostridium swellfunianum TaxID=1367462 RepID=UPI00202DB937|nr:S9 family peptidase [Clostridium swellfunianum]MCM0647187.1 S9 family peptidase [Clostridium swellfunianum]